MKIEVGKFYRTRGGRKAYVYYKVKNFDSRDRFHYIIVSDAHIRTCYPCGHFHIGESRPIDLVAPWVDEEEPKIGEWWLRRGKLSPIYRRIDSAADENKHYKTSWYDEGGEIDYGLTGRDDLIRKLEPHEIPVPDYKLSRGVLKPYSSAQNELNAIQEDIVSSVRKKHYKLADMWVVWIEVDIADDGYDYPKRFVRKIDPYYFSLDDARKFRTSDPSDKIIAITRADATGFYEGEGL